uniref:BRCT domain-containing protein n=1 Tax=Panagrolaimus davidi TaxID=227884 RepID=A0A914Q367_9BILA
MISLIFRMASKDDASKEQLFNHFQTDNKDQYTNFNLNSNVKCPILIPVQSSSKSNNDKNCDSVVSDTHKGKINSQTCNKSTDLCLNSLKIYDETEQEKLQNCWKTDSKNDSNNSTISLYISAYENSTEAAAAAIDDGLNGKKLNANTKQISTASSIFVFENPFEFPRQQNDKIFEPEVSQFKSSQQHRNPAIISRKKPQRRRMAGTCDDSDEESNESDSSTKILAGSSRKLLPPPTQSDRNFMESSNELSSMIADPIMDLDITIYEEEFGEYLEYCRLYYYGVTEDQKRVYRRLANCTGCASASSIDSATHIIVPPGNYSTNHINLLKEAVESDREVVRCEWLIACVQRQAEIDTEGYIYPGLGESDAVSTGQDSPRSSSSTQDFHVAINPESYDGSPASSSNLNPLLQDTGAIDPITVAERVFLEIKIHRINQTEFAEKILDLSQNRLSSLLKDKKSWENLTKKVQEHYKKMDDWLNLDVADRLKTFNKILHHELPRNQEFHESRMSEVAEFKATQFLRKPIQNCSPLIGPQLIIPKRIRIFISHLYHRLDSETQIPKWELRIEGRLIDDFSVTAPILPPSHLSTLEKLVADKRFSDFFSNVIFN